MPDQALSDVKVLDVSHHIAGPYLTKMLADYGADVVKVETPAGGDIARRMGPFPGDLPHAEKSGTFLHLNTNKKGITLDLKTKTGQKMFKELVRDVDIVVENFEPGVMPSWGLGYQALKEINPGLVMASISNFGQTGPYRDFKATEIVIFAMGGPMANTGTDGREPLKLYGWTSATQVALDAHIATLAALFHARLNGEGQHVDVSMFDAMVSSIDRRGNYLVSHAYSGRTESWRSARSAGVGIFSRLGMPCKDGYILFTMHQRYWNRFCRWIGHSELLDDPRFKLPADRIKPASYAYIDAIGGEFLMEHTMAELMDSMQKFEIPGGAVYTVAHVVGDPHFQSRDYFLEVEHTAAGSLTYPGAPWRPSETPWQLRWPAPTLGQHNEEIFCGRLGYTPADLVRLRRLGII